MGAPTTDVMTLIGIYIDVKSLQRVIHDEHKGSAD